MASFGQIFSNPIKSYVFKVLDDALGKYVDGLTWEAFNVSLASGEATFSNLRLRHDALDALNLPIEVESGSLQALRVSIPLLSYIKQYALTWSFDKIRAPPIEIDFSGINLVISPKQQLVAPKEKNMAEDAIRRKIAALEREWTKRLKQRIANWQIYGTGAKEAQSTAIANFVQMMLIVRVSNVHLLYLDTLSDPGRTFRLGVVLDSFTIDRCESSCCTAPDSSVDTAMGEMHSDTSKSLASVANLVASGRLGASKTLLHKVVQWDGLHIYLVSESTHARDIVRAAESNPKSTTTLESPSSYFPGQNTDNVEASSPNTSCIRAREVAGDSLHPTFASQATNLVTKLLPFQRNESKSTKDQTADEEEAKRTDKMLQTLQRHNIPVQNKDVSSSFVLFDSRGTARFSRRNTQSQHVSSALSPAEFVVHLHIPEVNFEIAKSHGANVRALMSYTTAIFRASRYSRFSRPPLAKKTILSPEESARLSELLHFSRLSAAARSIGIPMQAPAPAPRVEDVEFLRNGGKERDLPQWLRISSPIESPIDFQIDSPQYVLPASQKGPNWEGNKQLSPIPSSRTVPVLDIEAHSGTGSEKTQQRAVSEAVHATARDNDDVPQAFPSPPRDPYLDISVDKRRNVQKRARGWWGFAINCLLHDLRERTAHLTSDAETNGSGKGFYSASREREAKKSIGRETLSQEELKRLRGEYITCVKLCWPKLWCHITVPPVVLPGFSIVSTTEKSFSVHSKMDLSEVVLYENEFTDASKNASINGLRSYLEKSTSHGSPHSVTHANQRRRDPSADYGISSVQENGQVEKSSSQRVSARRQRNQVPQTALEWVMDIRPYPLSAHLIRVHIPSVGTNTTQIDSVDVGRGSQVNKSTASTAVGTKSHGMDSTATESAPRRGSLADSDAPPATSKKDTSGKGTGVSLEQKDSIKASEAAEEGDSGPSNPFQMKESSDDVTKKSFTHGTQLLEIERNAGLGIETLLEWRVAAETEVIMEHLSEVQRRRHKMALRVASTESRMVSVKDRQTFLKILEGRASASRLSTLHTISSRERDLSTIFQLHTDDTKNTYMHFRAKRARHIPAEVDEAIPRGIAVPIPRMPIKTPLSLQPQKRSLSSRRVDHEHRGLSSTVPSATPIPDTLHIVQLEPDWQQDLVHVYLNESLVQNTQQKHRISASDRGRNSHMDVVGKKMGSLYQRHSLPPSISGSDVASLRHDNEPSMYTGIAGEVSSAKRPSYGMYADAGAPVEGHMEAGVLTKDQKLIHSSSSRVERVNPFTGQAEKTLDEKLPPIDPSAKGFFTNLKQKLQKRRGSIPDASLTKPEIATSISTSGRGRSTSILKESTTQQRSRSLHTTYDNTQPHNTYAEEKHPSGKFKFLKKLRGHRSSSAVPKGKGQPMRPRLRDDQTLSMAGLYLLDEESVRNELGEGWRNDMQQPWDVSTLVVVPSIVGLAVSLGLHSFNQYSEGVQHYPSLSTSSLHLHSRSTYTSENVGAAIGPTSRHVQPLSQYSSLAPLVTYPTLDNSSVYERIAGAYSTHSQTNGKDKFSPTSSQEANLATRIITPSQAFIEWWIERYLAFDFLPTEQSTLEKLESVAEQILTLSESEDSHSSRIMASSLRSTNKSHFGLSSKSEPLEYSRRIAAVMHSQFGRFRDGVRGRKVHYQERQELLRVLCPIHLLPFSASKVAVDAFSKDGLYNPVRESESGLPTGYVRSRFFISVQRFSFTLRDRPLRLVMPKSKQKETSPSTVLFKLESKSLLVALENVTGGLRKISTTVDDFVIKYGALPALVQKPWSATLSSVHSKHETDPVSSEAEADEQSNSHVSTHFLERVLGFSRRPLFLPVAASSLIPSVSDVHYSVPNSWRPEKLSVDTSIRPSHRPAMTHDFSGISDIASIIGGNASKKDKSRKQKQKSIQIPGILEALARHQLRNFPPIHRLLLDPESMHALQSHAMRIGVTHWLNLLSLCIEYASIVHSRSFQKRFSLLEQIYEILKYDREIVRPAALLREISKGTRRRDPHTPSVSLLFTPTNSQDQLASFGIGPMKSTDNKKEFLGTRRKVPQLGDNSSDEDEGPQSTRLGMLRALQIRSVENAESKFRDTSANSPSPLLRAALEPNYQDENGSRPRKALATEEKKLEEVPWPLPVDEEALIRALGSETGLNGDLGETAEVTPKALGRSPTGPFPKAKDETSKSRFKFPFGLSSKDKRESGPRRSDLRNGEKSFDFPGNFLMEEPEKLRRLGERNKDSKDEKREPEQAQMLGSHLVPLPLEEKEMDSILKEFEKFFASMEQQANLPLDEQVVTFSSSMIQAMVKTLTGQLLQGPMHTFLSESWCPLHQSFRTTCQGLNRVASCPSLNEVNTVMKSVIETTFSSFSSDFTLPALQQSGKSSDFIHSDSQSFAFQCLALEAITQVYAPPVTVRVLHNIQSVPIDGNGIKRQHTVPLSVANNDDPSAPPDFRETYRNHIQNMAGDPVEVSVSSDANLHGTVPWRTSRSAWWVQPTPLSIIAPQFDTTAHKPLPSSLMHLQRNSNTSCLVNCAPHVSPTLQNTHRSMQASTIGVLYCPMVDEQKGDSPYGDRKSSEFQSFSECLTTLRKFTLQYTALEPALEAAKQLQQFEVESKRNDGRGKLEQTNPTKSEGIQQDQGVDVNAKEGKRSDATGSVDLRYPHQLEEQIVRDTVELKSHPQALQAPAAWVVVHLTFDAAHSKLIISPSPFTNLIDQSAVVPALHVDLEGGSCSMKTWTPTHSISYDSTTARPSGSSTLFPNPFELLETSIMQQQGAQLNMLFTMHEFEDIEDLESSDDLTETFAQINANVLSSTQTAAANNTTLLPNIDRTIREKDIDNASIVIPLAFTSESIRNSFVAICDTFIKRNTPPLSVHYHDQQLSSNGNPVQHAVDEKEDGSKSFASSRSQWTHKDSLHSSNLAKPITSSSVPLTSDLLLLQNLSSQSLPIRSQIRVAISPLEIVVHPWMIMTLLSLRSDFVSPAAIQLLTLEEEDMRQHELLLQQLENLILDYDLHEVQLERNLPFRKWAPTSYKQDIEGSSDRISRLRSARFATIEATLLQVHRIQLQARRTTKPKDLAIDNSLLENIHQASMESTFTGMADDSEDLYTDDEDSSAVAVEELSSPYMDAPSYQDNTSRSPLKAHVTPSPSDSSQARNRQLASVDQYKLEDGDQMNLTAFDKRKSTSYSRHRSKHSRMMTFTESLPISSFHTRSWMLGSLSQSTVELGATGVTSPNETSGNAHTAGQYRKLAPLSTEAEPRSLPTTRVGSPIPDMSFSQMGTLSRRPADGPHFVTRTVVVSLRDWQMKPSPEIHLALHGVTVNLPVVQLPLIRERLYSISSNNVNTGVEPIWPASDGNGDRKQAFCPQASSGDGTKNGSQKQMNAILTFPIHSTIGTDCAQWNHTSLSLMLSIGAIRTSPTTVGAFFSQNQNCSSNFDQLVNYWAITVPDGSAHTYPMLSPTKITMSNLSIEWKQLELHSSRASTNDIVDSKFSHSNSKGFFKKDFRSRQLSVGSNLADKLLNAGTIQLWLVNNLTSTSSKGAHNPSDSSALPEEPIMALREASPNPICSSIGADSELNSMSQRAAIELSERISSTSRLATSAASKLFLIQATNFDITPHLKHIIPLAYMGLTYKQVFSSNGRNQIKPTYRGSNVSAIDLSGDDQQRGNRFGSPTQNEPIMAAHGTESGKGLDKGSTYASNLVIPIEYQCALSLPNSQPIKGPNTVISLFIVSFSLQVYIDSNYPHTSVNASTEYLGANDMATSSGITIDPRSISRRGTLPFSQYQNDPNSLPWRQNVLSPVVEDDIGVSDIPTSKRRHSCSINLIHPVCLLDMVVQGIQLKRIKGSFDVYLPIFATHSAQAESRAFMKSDEHGVDQERSSNRETETIETLEQQEDLLRLALMAYYHKVYQDSIMRSTSMSYSEMNCSIQSIDIFTDKRVIEPDSTLPYDHAKQKRYQSSTIKKRRNAAQYKVMSISSAIPCSLQMTSVPSKQHANKEVWYYCPPLPAFFLGMGTLQSWNKPSMMPTEPIDDPTHHDRRKRFPHLSTGTIEYAVESKLPFAPVASFGNIVSDDIAHMAEHDGSLPGKREGPTESSTMLNNPPFLGQDLLVSLGHVRLVPDLQCMIALGKHGMTALNSFKQVKAQFALPKSTYSIGSTRVVTGTAPIGFSATNSTVSVPTNSASFSRLFSSQGSSAISGQDRHLLRIARTQRNLLNQIHSFANTEDSFPPNHFPVDTVGWNTLNNPVTKNEENTIDTTGYEDSLRHDPALSETASLMAIVEHRKGSALAIDSDMTSDVTIDKQVVGMRAASLASHSPFVSETETTPDDFMQSQGVTGSKEMSSMTLKHQALAAVKLQTMRDTVVKTGVMQRYNTLFPLLAGETYGFVPPEQFHVDVRHTAHQCSDNLTSNGDGNNSYSQTEIPRDTLKKILCGTLPVVERSTHVKSRLLLAVSSFDFVLTNKPSMDGESSLGGPGKSLRKSKSQLKGLSYSATKSKLSQYTVHASSPDLVEPESPSSISAPTTHFNPLHLYHVISPISGVSIHPNFHNALSTSPFSLICVRMASIRVSKVVDGPTFVRDNTVLETSGRATKKPRPMRSFFASHNTEASGSNKYQSSSWKKGPEDKSTNEITGSLGDTGVGTRIRGIDAQLHVVPGTTYLNATFGSCILVLSRPCVKESFGTLKATLSPEIKDHLVDGTDVKCNPRDFWTGVPFGVLLFTMDDISIARITPPKISREVLLTDDTTPLSSFFRTAVEALPQIAEGNMSGVIEKSTTRQEGQGTCDAAAYFRHRGRSDSGRVHDSGTRNTGTPSKGLTRHLSSPLLFAGANSLFEMVEKHPTFNVMELVPTVSTTLVDARTIAVFVEPDPTALPIEYARRFYAHHTHPLQATQMNEREDTSTNADQVQAKLELRSTSSIRQTYVHQEPLSNMSTASSAHPRSIEALPSQNSSVPEDSAHSKQDTEWVWIPGASSHVSLVENVLLIESLRVPHEPVEAPEEGQNGKQGTRNRFKQWTQNTSQMRNSHTTGSLDPEGQDKSVSVGPSTNGKSANKPSDPKLRSLNELNKSRCDALKKEHQQAFRDMTKIVEDADYLRGEYIDMLLGGTLLVDTLLDVLPSQCPLRMNHEKLNSKSIESNERAYSRSLLTSAPEISSWWSSLCLPPILQATPILSTGFSEGQEKICRVELYSPSIPLEAMNNMYSPELHKSAPPRMSESNHDKGDPRGTVHHNPREDSYPHKDTISHVVVPAIVLVANSVCIKQISTAANELLALLKRSVSDVKSNNPASTSKDFGDNHESVVSAGNGDGAGNISATSASNPTSGDAQKAGHIARLAPVQATATDNIILQNLVQQAQDAYVTWMQAGFMIENGVIRLDSVASAVLSPQDATAQYREFMETYHPIVTKILQACLDPSVNKGVEIRQTMVSTEESSKDLDTQNPNLSLLSSYSPLPKPLLPVPSSFQRGVSVPHSEILVTGAYFQFDQCKASKERDVLRHINRFLNVELDATSAYYKNSISTFPRNQAPQRLSLSIPLEEILSKRLFSRSVMTYYLSCQHLSLYDISPSDPFSEFFESKHTTPTITHSSVPFSLTQCRSADHEQLVVLPLHYLQRKLTQVTTLLPAPLPRETIYNRVQLLRELSVLLRGSMRPLDPFSSTGTYSDPAAAIEFHTPISDPLRPWRQLFIPQTPLLPGWDSTPWGALATRCLHSALIHGPLQPHEPEMDLDEFRTVRTGRTGWTFGRSEAKSHAVSHAKSMWQGTTKSALSLPVLQQLGLHVSDAGSASHRNVSQLARTDRSVTTSSKGKHASTTKSTSSRQHGGLHPINGNMGNQYGSLASDVPLPNVFLEQEAQMSIGPKRYVESRFNLTHPTLGDTPGWFLYRTSSISVLTSTWLSKLLASVLAQIFARNEAWQFLHAQRQMNANDSLSHGELHKPTDLGFVPFTQSDAYPWPSKLSPLNVPFDPIELQPEYVLQFHPLAPLGQSHLFQSEVKDYLSEVFNVSYRKRFPDEGEHHAAYESFWRETQATQQYARNAQPSRPQPLKSPVDEADKTLLALYGPLSLVARMCVMLQPEPSIMLTMLSPIKYNPINSHAKLIVDSDTKKKEANLKELIRRIVAADVADPFHAYCSALTDAFNKQKETTPSSTFNTDRSVGSNVPEDIQLKYPEPPLPIPVPLPPARGVDPSTCTFMRIHIRDGNFIYFKRWLDELKAVIAQAKASVMKGADIWWGTLLPRAVAHDWMIVTARSMQVILPGSSGSQERLNLHSTVLPMDRQHKCINVRIGNITVMNSLLFLSLDGRNMNNQPFPQITATTQDRASTTDFKVRQSKHSIASGRPERATIPMERLYVHGNALHLSIIKPRPPHDATNSNATTSPRYQLALQHEILQPLVQSPYPLVARPIVTAGEFRLATDTPLGFPNRVVSPIVNGIAMTLYQGLNAGVSLKDINIIQEVQKANFKERGSLLRLLPELLILPPNTGFHFIPPPPMPSETPVVTNMTIHSQTLHFCNAELIPSPYYRVFYKQREYLLHLPALYTLPFVEQQLRLRQYAPYRSSAPGSSLPITLAPTVAPVTVSKQGKYSYTYPVLKEAGYELTEREDRMDEFTLETEALYPLLALLQELVHSQIQASNSSISTTQATTADALHIYEKGTRNLSMGITTDANYVISLALQLQKQLRVGVPSIATIHSFVLALILPFSHVYNLAVILTTPVDGPMQKVDPRLDILRSVILKLGPYKVLNDVSRSFVLATKRIQQLDPLALFTTPSVDTYASIVGTELNVANGTTILGTGVNRNHLTARTWRYQLLPVLSAVLSITNHIIQEMQDEQRSIELSLQRMKSTVERITKYSEEMQSNANINLHLLEAKLLAAEIRLEAYESQFGCEISPVSLTTFFRAKVQSLGLDGLAPDDTVDSAPHGGRNLKIPRSPSRKPLKESMMRDGILLSSAHTPSPDSNIKNMETNSLDANKRAVNEMDESSLQSRSPNEQREAIDTVDVDGQKKIIPTFLQGFLASMTIHTILNVVLVFILIAYVAYSFIEWR